ncbi:MAG: anti-sigma factor family protein [Planctomycetota bacterium]|jgi:hypothetical protein
MNQREEQNIEELLNSFVDGELTRREANEVERLIADDAQIAQQLRELQKSKVLVGSLPRAEAPAEMAEEIKASLRRRTLLGQRAERFDERAGARHLLARKVLAAAAMIGLVAILAGVVYTIVAPEAGYKPSGGALAFNGRLELKTSNLAAVDAAIKMAIEDKGLKYSSPGSRGDKSVYALNCSREDLNLLLADMDNIWERFDSATLFVETKTPGRRVVVDDVSAKQVADLITIPKPEVLGPEEKIEKPTPPTPVERDEQVHFTIVVGSSE